MSIHFPGDGMKDSSNAVGLFPNVTRTLLPPRIVSSISSPGCADSTAVTTSSNAVTASPSMAVMTSPLESAPADGPSSSTATTTAPSGDPSRPAMPRKAVPD